MLRLQRAHLCLHVIERFRALLAHTPSAFAVCLHRQQVTTCAASRTAACLLTLVSTPPCGWSVSAVRKQRLQQEALRALSTEHKHYELRTRPTGLTILRLMRRRSVSVNSGSSGSPWKAIGRPTFLLGCTAGSKAELTAEWQRTQSIFKQLSSLTCAALNTWGARTPIDPEASRVQDLMLGDRKASMQWACMPAIVQR